jgi:hypothetical protein
MLFLMDPSRVSYNVITVLNTEMLSTVPELEFLFVVVFLDDTIVHFSYHTQGLRRQSSNPDSRGSLEAYASDFGAVWD